MGLVPPGQRKKKPDGRILKIFKKVKYWRILLDKEKEICYNSVEM